MASEAPPTELPQTVANLDIPPVAAQSGWRTVWPVFVLIVLAPIAVTVIAVMPIMSNPTPGQAGAMGTRLLLTFGVIILLVVGLTYWSMRRLARINKKQWIALGESQGNAPWVTALRSCLVPNWRRAWRWSKLRNADAAAAAPVIRDGQPGRIAFVAASLAPSLVAHTAPQALLEPEEIGHSFSRRQAWFVLLPLFFIGRGAVAKVLSGTPLEWYDLLSLLAFGAFLLTAVAWFASALGEKFSALKTTRGIVRAGPGWVDDTAGRRWTIQDSVLIIQELAPAKKPHYQAILIGPMGLFALPIARGDGPAFINLWQRWTTQKPRLDLMEPIVAPRELRLISRLWRGKQADPPPSSSSGSTGV